MLNRESVTKLKSNLNGIVAKSSVERSQRIIYTKNIFSLKNKTIANQLSDAPPSLIIVTPTIYKLHGKEIESYFEYYRGKDFDKVEVIRLREQNKNINSVLAVCRMASEMNLLRRSFIVAIGGGVCSDICGFASSIFRRGINHIKIPTTLIGLIDAGIATKNGVNEFEKKNSLGNFYPPTSSIIDTEFLNTLPARHLKSGLAEILKLAVVIDSNLFVQLEKNAKFLIDSNFAGPSMARTDILRASISISHPNY